MLGQYLATESPEIGAESAVRLRQFTVCSSMHKNASEGNLEPPRVWCEVPWRQVNLVVYSQLMTA